MSKVMIAFQDNEEARFIVEAIEMDNPGVTIVYNPAMIRLENEKTLTIKKETVSEVMGQDWEVQSIHVNLLSLSGHIDEDTDYFTLHWND